MSVVEASRSEAIFDASGYDLPIPVLDGHKADKLILSFSGQVELDRTSAEDLELIETLMLGRDITCSVVAVVAKKGFTYTAKDDDSQAGYGVGLRVHSLQT